MPIIKPRDYQKDALEALSKGRRQGSQRQLVALPTGSGKTIIAALDIERVVKATGKGAVFMAHRDELITQPAKKIPLVWEDATIGRVKAESNQLGRQVTVASVQTIHRDKRLAELIEAQEYSLLYVDEAHHATADSYRKVIDAMTAANPDMNVVGLTATPVRSDATRMNQVFTEVTFHLSMLDLIEAGYLSDIQLRQIPLKVSIDGIPKQGGDLKASEVRKVLSREDIIVSMIDAWKAYGAPRRTIVFAIDVAHAAHLAQVFKARGVKATHIYGDLDTETRRERLAAFQSGKVDVIINVGILTEGFDDQPTGDALPLSCIMLARPTLSQSLYIQSIGRGTRLAPLKDNCLVLDFAYNSSRHHIVQLPHLFGMDEMPTPRAKKKKQEGEVEPKHIPSILAAVKEAREVDIRKPPPRAGLRWAKTNHGFALAIGAEHGYILIRPNNDDPKMFEVFHLDPPQRASNEARSLPRGDEYIVHRLSKKLSFDWAFGLAEDATRELREARSKSRTMRKTKYLECDADWLAFPPTDAQLRALSRAGEKPKNRGEATNMITSMIVERIISDRRTATDKQVKFMRWKKIDFPEKCSIGHAKRLITKFKLAEKAVKGQQSFPI